MSRETSKTLKYYPNFVHHLYDKDVIDIGCGSDPIPYKYAKSVRSWDLADGDAQYMESIPDESFDVIWASHVLEHMVDVPTTISHWMRILRPGGEMMIFVPHFIYYEKCRWPSLYNSDHKQTFGGPSPSQVGRMYSHWDENTLASVVTVRGGTLWTWRDMIDGFSFRGRDFMLDQTLGDSLAQIYINITKDSQLVAPEAAQFALAEPA
jgi:predicted SAM-dependent methyltransferase